MTDDFCRAVRQAMPDIAQSVVTAIEDDLADCRARLAEVEAENERLRDALKFYRDEWCNYSKDDFDSYGGGHRGPSPALSSDKGERARAALAQTKEPSDDG